jgi:ribosomal protein L11 methylase PrmA
LNTSHAQNHLFDLIVADIENISESLLESYMNILDEGGTVVLTGSNNFILESNKTKEITIAEAALLHQIILIRGRQDLDLATLDADTGDLVSNHASILEDS